MRRNKKNKSLPRRDCIISWAPASLHFRLPFVRYQEYFGLLKFRRCIRGQIFCLAINKHSFTVWHSTVLKFDYHCYPFIHLLRFRKIYTVSVFLPQPERTIYLHTISNSIKMQYLCHLIKTVSPTRKWSWVTALLNSIFYTI